MEPNGTNENRCASVILCRMGCGFYGSLACDGMCSKCYKDVSKARHESSVSEKMNNQSSSATSNEMSSNSGRSHINIQSQSTRTMTSDMADNFTGADGSSAAGVATALTQMSLTSQGRTTSDDPLRPSSSASDTGNTATAGAACSAENIDCQSARVSVTPLSDFKATAADKAEASGSAASSESESGSTSSAKTKKNRCSTCNKKVGLTGFPCRCGGLYCSLHRYSDVHACTFNYKELAQEDIRKNNPVVVSEKVKKI